MYVILLILSRGFFHVLTCSEIDWNWDRYSSEHSSAHNKVEAIIDYVFTCELYQHHTKERYERRQRKIFWSLLLLCVVLLSFWYKRERVKIHIDTFQLDAIEECTWKNTKMWQIAEENLTLTLKEPHKRLVNVKLHLYCEYIMKYLCKSNERCQFKNHQGRFFLNISSLQ